MNPISTIVPVEFISSRSSSLSFLHSILKSLSDEVVVPGTQSLSALEQAAESLLESKNDNGKTTFGGDRVFTAAELPRHLRRRTTSHLSASARHKHPERGQGGQQISSHSRTQSEKDPTNASTGAKRRRIDADVNEELHEKDEVVVDEGSLLISERRSRRRTPVIMKEFWRKESINALQALSDLPIALSTLSSATDSKSITSKLSFRSLLHLWLAKRMRMQKTTILSPEITLDPSTDDKRRNMTTVECILPLSRLDTSISAAQEWASSTSPSTCVAFDTSHLIAVALKGSRAHLLCLLRSVLDPNSIESNIAIDDDDHGGEKDGGDGGDDDSVVATISDPVSASLATTTTMETPISASVAPPTSSFSRAKKAKLRRAAATCRWKKLSQNRSMSESKVSPSIAQDGGILSREFVSGACAAVDVMLYSPNLFPRGALAPVTIVWLPSEGGKSGQTSRQVLILVHIAALQVSMIALRDAASASCPPGAVAVSIAGNEESNPPPCIVSLRGPGTRDAISSLNCSFFKNAGVASTSSSNVEAYAKNIVYGVTAFSASSADSFSSESLKIATSLARAAESICKNEYVPLIEDAQRNLDSTKGPKKNEKEGDNTNGNNDYVDDGFLALESSRPLQSGDNNNNNNNNNNEKEEEQAASSSSLLLGAPIMFIKRACSGPKKRKEEREGLSTVDTVDSCILVIPPSAAQDVWLQLVTRGKARAVGDVEWGTITCERGHPYFPRDYPETVAGKTWWEQKSQAVTTAEGAKSLLKRKQTRLSSKYSFAPKWNLLWPSSISISTTEPHTDDKKNNDLVDKEDDDDNDDDKSLPLVVRQEEFKSSFLSPGGSVAAHPTLLPFRLVFPGRAPVITDVAGIYLPTNNDISLWNESLSSLSSLPSSSDQHHSTRESSGSRVDLIRTLISHQKMWLGVEEVEEKKKQIMENDEENGEATNSARTLIGFVTSLCLNPSISRVIGTAFVEAEACRTAAVTSETTTDEVIIKVLVRSPFSTFYHPAVLLN